MIKNTLLLLLLICTAFGCSPSVSKDASQLPTYYLRHKFYQELIIRTPNLSVMGNYLIVSSSSERDTVCRFYAIDKGMEEVASYGRIGQGPEEFFQPRLTYTNEHEFAMNDINHSILAIIGVYEKNGKLDIRETKRLKGVFKPTKGELALRDYDYKQIGDSFFVSKLLAGEGRFFNLLDSTLVPIQSFGESPVKEEVDPFVIADRLQGKMHVYKNKMFYGATDLPYLASYTLRNGQMQKDWSIYYDTPHYVLSNGDVKLKREHSKGPLFGVQADDNYIYLLYRDRLLWELETKEAGRYTDEISVFDHQGNKMAILKLDCNLSYMVIDKKRNKIYGLAHIPDYALVEFDLPEELQ